MSNLSIFGIRGSGGPRREEGTTEHLMIRRSLERVLAFRNRTIDDVVNDPFVKNEIFGYWKLHKQILRTSEVVDLERQWNPGRRGGP
jgi:hypothetical protein